LLLHTKKMGKQRRRGDKMIYDVSITIIFIVLLTIVLKNFIKIICFTKNDNFDKNYRATRIDANKYSIDKWLK
jgi:hypothetical protein